MNEPIDPGGGRLSSGGRQYVEVMAVSLHDSKETPKIKSLSSSARVSKTSRPSFLSKKQKNRSRVHIVHKPSPAVTFECEGKSSDPVASTRCFVELETHTTEIHLDRLDDFGKLERFPPVHLYIPSTCQENYRLTMSGVHSIDVTLIIGQKLTESDVICILAKESMFGALSAMDTKKRMMRRLDVCSTHLALLVNFGKSASELDTKAQFVAGIIQELFQRLSYIPNDYKLLQQTVLECNRHFDTVIKDSRATFTTVNASRAVDDWIRLVRDASCEIRSVYSESKSKFILKQVWSPRKSRIHSLRRQLEAHKAAISQAFLMEIKQDVNALRTHLDNVKTDVCTIRCDVKALHRHSSLSILLTFSIVFFD